MNKDHLLEKFKPLVFPYSGSGMLTNDRDEEVVKRNVQECANIAEAYYRNDGGTFIDYKYFCDQMNCTNVDSVTYEEPRGKWVIKYRNGLEPNEFPHFHQAIEFIFFESNQE